MRKLRITNGQLAGQFVGQMRPFILSQPEIPIRPLPGFKWSGLEVGHSIQVDLTTEQGATQFFDTTDIEDIRTALKRYNDLETEIVES